MPELTPLTETPTPLHTEAPNIPADMSKMAENLEKYTVARFSSAATRAVAWPEPPLNALSMLDTHPGYVWHWDGAQWVSPVNQRPFMIRVGVGGTADLGSFGQGHTSTNEESRRGDFSLAGGVSSQFRVPLTGIYDFSYTSRWQRTTSGQLGNVHLQLRQNVTAGTVNAAGGQTLRQIRCAYLPNAARDSGVLQGQIKLSAGINYMFLLLNNTDATMILNLEPDETWFHVAYYTEAP